MKHLFCSCLLILIALHVHAQNDPGCYTDYRSKGLEFMGKKNFGEAISQFVAGLVSCKELPANNDLARLVQEAKETWIRELQASSERERKAYLEAVTARDAAEQAQSKEKSAREEAVKNAQEAYKRGVKAESLRLALLADMVRVKGKVSDAVLLAWMSLQMSGEALPPFGVRAFNEAVRDSFSINIFNSPSPVVFMRYLPSHQRLLVENADHNFFVLGTGNQPTVTQLPENIARVVPGIKHDSLLVWEGGAKSIRVLGPDGATITTLTGHAEGIRDAVFMQGDALILSGSRDNTARIWDLKGTQTAVLEGHTAAVQEVREFPASGGVLTRSSDGTVNVWVMNQSIHHKLGGENALVRSLSTDDASAQIAVLFADGAAGLFDAEGKLIKDFGTGIKAVHCSGSSLVAVRAEKMVQLFSASGALVASCPHRTKVLGTGFQNGHLITWDEDHDVRIWNTNGAQLHEFIGHRETVISAVLSPDGKHLLSTSKDGTAKLWDLEGNIMLEWSIGTNDPAPAIFSPDGQQILVASNGGKSVMLTVLPMQIYKSVKSEPVLQSPGFSKATAVYNIQFVEVLKQRQD
ncbi:MAG: hypothetical protein Q7T20_18175 [Saprospiraceae bacterium]|nr:hypothetical protein [Saprospiraceae bacterium]